MGTETFLTAVAQKLRAGRDLATADGDLLRRYAHEHDQEAFETLVHRYGRLVLGVAQRQLAAVQPVEDVFQGTFLALAQSAGRLHRQTPLANWLYTVALRLARKTRLRSARRTKAEYAAPRRVGVSSDPLAEISGRELLRVIDEELAALPDRDRLPVLLCCVQGLTREEAAGQLGCSEGVLKGRLERGRQRLADRLASRGLTPTAVMSILTAAVAVPSDLIARTAELAVAPWSSAVPFAVAALSRTAELRRSVAAMALMGSLLVVGVVGWSIAAWGEKPVVPASLPAAPAVEPARVSPDDPLPAGSVLRFGTSRFRQGVSIVTMAVSADGKTAYVVSGSRSNGSTRAIDLVSGRTLFNENGDGEAIAISPDGRTIVIKANLQLSIRDAKSGQPIRTIDLPKKSNLRSEADVLAFTPDGKAVATITDSKDIHLIDFESGKTIREFVHDNPESSSGFPQVLAVAFSPDGKLMATGGYAKVKDDYFARLWDVESGKEIRRFMHWQKGYGIRCLAFSPDGKTLATLGTQSGVFLRLFDVDTGNERRAFPKDGNLRPEGGSVRFSPDGKTVVAALNSIHLYDVATGEERLRIDQRASNLHFTDGGKTLTGSVSGAIYRWDTTTGKTLTPEAGDSVVEQILVTPDGNRVVTRDQDGYGHIWDGTNGKHLRRISVAWQRGLAMTPDGRFLAWTVNDSSVTFTVPHMPRSINDGSRIRLYDIVGDKLIDRFPAFKGDAQDLAFTNDGKKLVSIDQHAGRVRTWNCEEGKEERSFDVLPEDLKKQSFFVRQTRLSPDGKTAVATYEKDLGGRLGGTRLPPQLVRLWDVANGKQFPQLGGGYLANPAFSPDGRLVFGGHDVHEIATGRRVAALPDEPYVRAAAFSLDGRYLATAVYPGLIQIWEVATWTKRNEFNGYDNQSITLTFGPGGRLFTGNLDTTTLAWDTRPPKKTGVRLDDAWDELTKANAAMAYQAQGALLAAETETVTRIAGVVKPVTPVDRDRAARLIADLDSPEFAVRERASRDLGAMGHPVSGMLRDVLKTTTSPEVRKRASDVLTKIEQSAATPDELRHRRAIELLEWIGSPEARTVLRDLAKGAPDAPLTRDAASSLERLDRRKSIDSR